MSVTPTFFKDTKPVKAKKLIIGLTGGIGSGKSEVSRRFQLLGITVVDADEIARLVVEPHQPVLAVIEAHFGSQILINGRLDRAQLRAIIFSNPEEKMWLENLLHPIINTLTRQQLVQANSPYTILSSPLLLETKQYQLVDRVLVVDAGEDLQISRASSRDKNNLEQIKAIMATQVSRQTRLAKADDIIDNNGDLLTLDQQVYHLHHQYLALVNSQ